MWEYRASLRPTVKGGIVDADTIDVSIDLGFGVSVFERLRLARIDAPEMQGDEKEAGEAARLALVGKLAESENRLIIQTSKGTGKYGRWIAEVYVGEGSTRTNINDWLVEQGHAEYYE
ncbi:MAG: thermonuclease family protein [Acidimicrobiia bacterium]